MECCPRCDELKSILINKKISFKESSLNDPETVIDLMYKGADITAAPLLSIKDHIFSGKELFSKLDSLLTGN